MKPRIPFRAKTGIRFQLFLLLVLSSLIMSFFLFAIIRSISENKAEAELRENSDLLLFVLDWTVAPLLVNSDIPAIQSLFEKIGKEQFITNLRLFDSDYHITASNIPEEVGKKFPMDSLESLIIGDLPVFRDISQVAYVSAISIRGAKFDKIQSLDIPAVLYLEMNRKVYLQSYNRFLYGTLLASFGALLIISALILISFNRWVAEPLKKLRKATYEVSKGNYDVDVQIIRPLEFEQFSEIFNRMINELKQKDLEIRDYSFGLEEMVAERTAELADSILKLKQAQKWLIQQEKMASIGQLAAGVAHEINNPTGFVFSNLQTLEEYTDVLCAVIEMQESFLNTTEGTDLTVEQKNLWNEINAYKKEENLPSILSDIPSLLTDSKKGTSRISEIVKSLQSFARDDLEEPSDADLNESIESALKIVWNRIKYKCEIVKNLGVLPLVSCRKNEIEQVIVNLLVNAGDAIEEKGIITINSRVEGRAAVLQVLDNGTGISDEVKKSLFEPFFTTKKVGEGTGLGLSISRSLIEKHNGTIEVESTLGKGTDFTIKLPLKEDIIE
ncbi:MAG: ATP-binding protein [Spirochaetia bacterium]|jgi:signal transduction histidine kinase|nr:ATP-binding protein [Spirochaetia bacterium]